jgi:DNA-binding transcriptional LysR family regulator
MTVLRVISIKSKSLHFQTNGFSKRLAVQLKHMKLDLLSLKVFIYIVEGGSIAAAAERSHMAASAASKRISDLECGLKSKLLVRTNKGVEPTPAGVALANMARGVLHEIDDIVVQMGSFATGQRGHVRIVANISSIAQFLPTEIKSFLVKHPNVQIHLLEDTSSGIAKAVSENAADIGVLTMSPHGQKLDFFPYHIDELALIVPNEHALAEHKSISFVDTLEYDYVGLHAGSAINLQLIKAAVDVEKTVRMAIEVTSFDALCLMVEAGLGIGILPRAVAERYCKALDIRVLALRDTWARRELKICVRSLEALPVAAQLLVEHLRKSA